MPVTTSKLSFTLKITDKLQRLGSPVHLQLTSSIIQCPRISSFLPPAKVSDTNTAIFPNATIEFRFYYSQALTQADVDAIEANTKRIHCWGHATYQDAFGHSRLTYFSASAGGKEFAESQRAFMAGTKGPEWGWDYGDGHNDAT